MRTGNEDWNVVETVSDDVGEVIFVDCRMNLR